MKEQLKSLIILGFYKEAKKIFLICQKMKLENA